MGESENKKHLHRLGDYGQWFLESVEDYFATHQFSDVTLVVGKGRARERGNKQTLRAHALMLAAGSPVLAAKICKSRQISLDEDPNLFKIMLRYFYSGSVLCIGSQVTELKELFQRYEVGRAKELFDFGPGCCSEIVQDPEPPLEPKIETNPPCSSPSNPASGGSDRSKKSEAPPTTVQDRDLAAKNFCDENIFHLRIKTELQTEDEVTQNKIDSVFQFFILYFFFSPGHRRRRRLGPRGGHEPADAGADPARRGRDHERDHVRLRLRRQRRRGNRSRRR